MEVHASLHQVVLVAAVRVPDRVGVVLEDIELAVDAVLPEFLLGGQEQLFHDPLAGLLVTDHVAGIGALGRGVFGVGAIHVQTAAVTEDLVDGAIVLLVGLLMLPAHLESSGVEKRILPRVIPHCLHIREGGMAIDQQDGARHGIKARGILCGDPQFDFRPDDLFDRHLASREKLSYDIRAADRSRADYR